MPSPKKMQYYFSSALVTAIAVGVLGYGMSTVWATTRMDCAQSEDDISNGTAGTVVVTLELFDGTFEMISCPFTGEPDYFQVIPKLAQIAVTPAALHVTVVCLLVLCLLFSALSILISLYNSVSNPYETYMGPAGVYACSSLSVCLSVLALIIFVSNVNLANVALDVVQSFPATSSVELSGTLSQMQLGYYLVIPYAVLSLVSIALIYMYDHAAYTHRREQQRPTEDAPKEIMMY